MLDLTPQQMERVVATVPGGTGNIQDAYPLLPMQEGMLLHHMLEKQGDPYVIATALGFASRARLDAFIQALQKVIDRHDILRTAFLWEDLPQPIQVVYRRAVLGVAHLEFNRSGNRTEQLQEWLKPEWQRLDLRHAPQVRLSIGPAEDGVRWYALLQIHHLVCDALSHEIIVREVVEHLKGSVPALPTPIRYGDHVAWTLATARIQEAEKFFREKLYDVHEPTAPFGIVDMYEAVAYMDEASEALESALCERLRQQAKRHRVSAATLFHTAWGLVVSHTSGRNDVVYGTVLSGRLQMGAGVRQRVGMFLNTLPLRIRLENISIKEAVAQTQRGMLELLGYEQSSLAQAQQCSSIPKSLPLFTSLLNYRHGGGDPESDWTNDTLGIRLLGRRIWTNYPITLFVDDRGRGFYLTVQTNGRIDSRRMVRYARTAAQSLVEALEVAPETLALDVPVMSTAELTEVVNTFNPIRARYSQEPPRREYEAPVGDIEQTLAEIWAEVLGVREVSRYDNFFELGGHSLLSFKLLMKVSERFGIQSATVSIFRCPSVATMAQLVECLLSPLERAPPAGEMELDEGAL